MFLNRLCATNWIPYIPDILVGVFFLVMLIISARKGFINCILSIVSSVFAFILAISLAGALVDATGGLFGLQGVFSKGLTNSFAKIEGFNVDVSQTGVESALDSQNVTAILARLVLKMAGKQEQIAAGTTLAALLGEATGSLAVRLLAGLVIFIGIKIVIRILKKALSALVDKIPVLGGVNRWLGALFGLLYAWIIVSAILAVLAVIPAEGISLFFAKTTFVRFLYEHNVLVIILSWFV